MDFKVLSCLLKPLIWVFWFTIFFAGEAEFSMELDWKLLAKVILLELAFLAELGWDENSPLKY